MGKPALRHNPQSTHDFPVIYAFFFFFFSHLGFNNSFAGYFRKLCFCDQAYCAENSPLKLYHVLFGGWVLHHMQTIFYIKFA